MWPFSCGKCGAESDSFSSIFSYPVHNPVGEEDPNNATEEHEISASSTSETALI